MKSIILFYLFHVHPFHLFVTSQCHNKCSNHGSCNPHGQCECHHGFYGGDCSLRKCPLGQVFQNVLTPLEEECSGRGICDTKKGSCKCMNGYTGISCERATCANSCNYRGVCISNPRRILDSKSSLSRDESNLVSKSNIWEMKKIYTCKCDDGYDGYDCSERICTSGDDPLTNGGEQEMQLFNCFTSLIPPATLPSTTIIFSLGDTYSALIPVTASPIYVQNAMKSIGEVHVQYSYGNTLCSQDVNVNVVRITFLDLFGPLPALRPQVYDDEETKTVTSVTTVEVGAYDATIAVMTDYLTGIMYKSIKGSKENDICNQHGICERNTGICQCFGSNAYTFTSSNGYHEEGSRGDCGLLVSSSSLPIANLTSCPNNCNSNGVCDSTTKRCDCQDGYTGYDCTLRSCPHGYSWVNGKDWMECSLIGTCDVSSGNCVCRQGYFGAACEYMNCEFNSRDNIPCNGHGTCLTARTQDMILGKASQYFWYNLNKALDDRIFYCQCDAGYHGYDCSLQSCTQGKDPLDDDVDEEYDCSNHGSCDITSGTCSCFRGWGNGNNNKIKVLGSSIFSNNCSHRLSIYHLRKK